MNNKNYDPNIRNNIEDTSKLLTRSKVSGTLRIIAIVLAIVIVLGLVAFGIHFFIKRSAVDTASETLSIADFRGKYYSFPMSGDGPSMYEVSDSEITYWASDKEYYSEDGYPEMKFNYTLENTDGRTIIRLREINEEDVTSSVSYFKDLRIIWIGGEFILFKDLDSRMDYALALENMYYQNNDSTYEFLKGEWRDEEDHGSSFVYDGKDMELTMPYFSDKPLKLSDDEHYTFVAGGSSYSIERWTLLKYDEKGEVNGAQGINRQLNLIPIDDDHCIAYYADYEENGEKVYGHGTIFERVKK